jgi:hypothetical protein
MRITIILHTLLTIYLMQIALYPIGLNAMTMKRTAIAALFAAAMLLLVPAAALTASADDGANSGGGGGGGSSGGGVTVTITEGQPSQSCGWVVVPLLSPVTDGLLGFLLGWASVNVIVWMCSSNSVV